jgi:hypothetical protein
MRGNCFHFAIRRWWRTRHTGSYLLLRKSQHGWWLHALYHPADLKSEHLEQFTPSNPIRGMRFPPVWFHGFVKTGADFPPVKK